VTQYVIQGRDSVVEESKTKIAKILDEISRQVKGRESQFIHEIILGNRILFQMAKNGNEQSTGYLRYNASWYRITNDFTIALSRIIPRLSPIYRVKLSLRLNTLYEEFAESFFLALWLGRWIQLLECKWFDCIEVDNIKVRPISYSISDELNKAIQEYVDQVIDINDYAFFYNWFFKKELPRAKKFLRKLNQTFINTHGFEFVDLVNSVEYFESLIADDVLEIHRSKVQEVFSKNLRSGRASKLLKALIFTNGSNLFKSPLISLEGGYFLIVDWPFNMGQVLNLWFIDTIRSNAIIGDYGKLLGTSFEGFIKQEIQPYANNIRKNVVIQKNKCPQSIYWPVRKASKFEIDIIATRDEYAYLISCKGGKTELPKDLFSQLFAEFHYDEIINRIDENEIEILEIMDELKFIDDSKELKKKLGINNKTLIPVIVYAKVQPLQCRVLREIKGVPEEVRIITLNGLLKLLRNSS
jgi:hypothetical protein